MAKAIVQYIADVKKAFMATKLPDTENECVYIARCAVEESINRATCNLSWGLDTIDDIDDWGIQKTMIELRKDLPDESLAFASKCHRKPFR